MGGSGITGGSGAVSTGVVHVRSDGSNAAAMSGMAVAAPCSTTGPTDDSKSGSEIGGVTATSGSPFRSITGSAGGVNIRVGLPIGTTARRSEGSDAFNRSEICRGPPTNRGLALISFCAGATPGMPTSLMPGPLTVAVRPKLGS